MSRFGKCPKCDGVMEPIAIEDARNSRGRWVSAEFTICAACAFPVLRFVESSGWCVIVASNGEATEIEVSA